jgi:hypothetical protein
LGQNVPPEHEQLEADWLSSELDRCRQYAREAYTEQDDIQRRLFLANLVGTLDTLYTHFRLVEEPPQSGQHYQEPDHAKKNSWFGWTK